jgi:PAS domain S-box-containing protein
MLRRARLELPVASLVWLATAAVLLPGVVLSSYGLARWAADERVRQIERVADHARALAHTLDRELRGFVETAEVLAESRVLKSGDLKAFTEQARDTVMKTGGAIVVTDGAQRILVDTRSSQQAASRDSANGAVSGRVSGPGGPMVGDLVRDSGTGEHSFPIRVPVMVDHQVRFLLTYLPRPGVILQVVQQGQMEEGWRAAVLDATGRIVARSEHDATYVGKSATPEFVRTVLAVRSGVLESVDLEGRASVTAYRALDVTGWRVVVWVPNTVLDVVARRALQIALALATLTFLATLAAAWLGSRLITGPTRQLVALAATMGTGEPVRPVPGIMREANVVGSALAEAAAEIAFRESRLRDSETRFRDMANHAPVMIWVSEPDGATEFISQRWYDFTGEPARSCVGSDWLEAVHPDDKARVAECLAHARQNRHSVEIEFRLKRAGGTHAWVLGSALPRLSPSGELLGHIGSIIDITERRNGERDTAFHLGLSEKLLNFQGPQSELLAGIAADVCRHLGADSVQLYRKSGNTLMPLVRHDETGRAGLIRTIEIGLLSPQTAAETQNGRIVAVADSSTDPRTRDYYARGYEPYGLRSYVVAPLVGRVGLHACMIVTSDAPREWTAREIALVGAVAERVWSQIERRRLDERLRIAISGAELGIHERDLKTGIGYWSPSARAIYGAPDEYETNTEEQWLALVHPDDRPRVLAALDSARRGERYDLEFRVLDAKRGHRWVGSRAEVHLDEESGGARLIGICFDVSRRRQTEETLRESEKRMRLALDAGRMGAWTWQLDGGCEVDDTTIELFGLSRDEWKGDPQVFIRRILAEDKPAFEAAAVAAIERGEAFAAEFRVTLPDGSIRWIAGRGRVELDERGEPLLMRGVSFDITDRRQREAENLLLLREVNHRSKNMLAQVLAIARQTSAPNTQQYVRSLTQRVQALAASQDLLVRSDWRGAAMRDLAEAQLAQHQDLIGTRITLDGPDIDLLPSAVQSIGMALHELATNATHHGALSNGEGRVRISWSLEGEASRRFVLAWRETNGPQVAPPSRRGFGSTVAGAMVRLSLQGTIDTEMKPEGLAWRLECPAENAVSLCGPPDTSPAPPEQRRVETP